MSTKAILTIIKLFFSGKKGKKRLKCLLIGLGAFVLIYGAAISGSGLGTVSAANSVLEKLWDALSAVLDMTGKEKEAWLAGVNAGELLEAMEKGNIVLTADQEKDMRLAPGNFKYLLEKVYNYEVAAQQVRTIRVEGLHEYIEIRETESTDEDGNSTTETEEVPCEEYVYQEIEVSNREIESLHHIDWRLLYIFSLMTSLDHSNGRGSNGDVPEMEGSPWLIQKGDIDLVFEQLEMKYEYAFDVVRDNVETYGFEKSKQLPHTESISGNPDTTEGRYSYYFPKSLLNSGSSGYSTLAHTQGNGMITGVEEIFSRAKFESMGNCLSRFYNYRYLTTLLDYLEGGREIHKLFDWYIELADSGNAVIQSNVYLINPGLYQVNDDGRYSFGGQLIPDGIGESFGSTVGEAAVKVALSRLDWEYSQARRYQFGYWDCSSMVARIYNELGVEIPITSTTTTLLRTALSKKQVIPVEDLIPGDILLFQTETGVKAGNPQGVGHVVMYAGDGMIVHAASQKLGTIYQPLSSYYNPHGLIVCARPYLNIRSSFVPSGQAGSTLANNLGALTNAQVAKEVLELARKDSKKSGILPSVTAAQLLLESGFCRSDLAIKANNCFGMKTELSNNTWKNSTWDGVSIYTAATKEQDENGKEYTVLSAFRKYSSVESSIADHSAYLLGSMSGLRHRYEGLTNAKNYREAVTIIKKGGYATDIRYVDKVCRLIEQYGLNKYDRIPGNVGRSAGDGHLVAIDAGHQQRGNPSLEPMAPGSNQMKARVTSGTSGAFTRIDEYVVNLQVALLLQKELVNRGYQVYMVRDKHDVNISNAERAAMAEEHSADIFVRLHCNSADDSKVKGALSICQSKRNPWVGNNYKESRRLSELLLKNLCRATGAEERDILETDSMAGINWCNMPVTIVEMGFMSNPNEDKLLCSADYQKKLAIGMANGIDAYFNAN